MVVRLLVLVFAVVVASVGVVSSADAQDPNDDLRVTGVEVTEIGESGSTVRYEAAVEVLNEGSADFDGVARVDYQIDGGVRNIVWVITELAAGDALRFTFRFELLPGDHTVGIVIGDVAFETAVNVTVADLAVELTDQREVRGGKVELDLQITNRGERVASGIAAVGNWEDTADDSSGEVEFGPIVEILEPNGVSNATAMFEVDPGTYRIAISVSTTSLETNVGDNTIEIETDVEYVELDVKLKSAEPIKWISDESALMEIAVEIENEGVDDTVGVAIGFECSDVLCSTSSVTDRIAAGGKTETTLQVWMPLGYVFGTLYAGANEDGFRWGVDNSTLALVNVPDSPPLEWSLTEVSDVQEITYWSDGSANVVFETTLLNQGSDLVSGNIPMSVECIQNEAVIDDCGGELEIEVDPAFSENVVRRTLRVPQGVTDLYFSHGGEEPVAAVSVVPARILGVNREIWECFNDTSHLGTDAPRDWGVGCGGWRNDYVVKWPVGKPVKVWTSGDDAYEEIFSRVLDDVAPILNIEIQRLRSKRHADVVAFLGLPRSGTRLKGLECNHAAGCATFGINADGTIGSAQMVVWPPVTTLDDAGVDHMIYSIALHELIHILTGMLHRHDDHTSVMSYDSLDYKTLGPADDALLKIALHPLVEPGMKFDAISELIVFEDELVDPPLETELSVRQILRDVHAKLMEAGSASYEIKGGWPSCESEFDRSEYQFGSLRPRAPRTVHFKNDGVDIYIIRTLPPARSIQYWVDILGSWRRLPSAMVLSGISFRDSFTNPLGLLSSINIYGADEDLNLLSDMDNRLTLQASLEGADVGASWSRKTQVDVELEIDTEEFTIQRYVMDWTFDPAEANICRDYHVEARVIDYGTELIFPEAIRNSGVLHE